MGHSADAIEMLDDYLIGILPKKERMYNESTIIWWTQSNGQQEYNKQMTGSQISLFTTPIMIIEIIPSFPYLHNLSLVILECKKISL